nr:MAG TPA: hypothetical protein [Caudoviricetes sp.]
MYKCIEFLDKYTKFNWNNELNRIKTALNLLF